MRTRVIGVIALLVLVAAVAGADFARLARVERFTLGRLAGGSSTRASVGSLNAAERRMTDVGRTCL